MSETLGHIVVGSGPLRVIALNDWICDTTTWDFVRPLFDAERFSWALVDLRGYGRSRAIEGDYTLAEASGDVLRTADTLGWDHFSLIGHSMSSLVVLHVGQTAAERIDKIVVIAPPPPAGLGADEATALYLKGVALGNPAQRSAGLDAMWGDRLSERWRAYKAERWERAANAKAAAGYVDMFARHGLPDPQLQVLAPVLALTGEQDAEIMRSDAVLRALSPLCPDFSIQPIQEVGHYPMQEAPPLTYTLVERFLASAEG